MAMRRWLINAVIATSAIVVACFSVPLSASTAASAKLSLRFDHKSSSSETISGVVVDAGGQAVHGARVTLVPMGLFDPSGARFVSVRSAADGTFHLVGAGSGRYGVTATALGHTAASVANIEVGRSGVRLQLGSGGRHLSGFVSDRNGRRRGGAEVRLALGFGEKGDIFLVDSAADGSWSVVVPPGDYYANAVLAGYAAAQKMLPQGRDSIDLVLDPVWPTGPPPPLVVDWLRRHEIPLATVEAGRGFADLAPLRAVVGDARVVGLGEATHGTREIFQLKHRLFEYLVSEMGFTVLAIEFSLPESFAIDDYVMGGGGDPEQLIAGQFVAVWQAEELLDLVRWMREWNRTHERKVRFHGLDMRMGIRAAKETFAYLARVDRAALSSPAALALASMADPVAYREVVRGTGPELAALSAHARELVVRFDDQRAEYAARSSPELWWRSAMQARALAQLLESRATADSAGRVHVRERAMADNVIRILEHHGPDARAVVWAHNAHIAGDVEAEPRMMGVHLRERLDTGYRAFGSLLHRGAYQAVDASSLLLRDFRVAPAVPGSLEDAFAAAGSSIAALDLRSLQATDTAAEWFRAFQAMRQFDGLYEDQRPEGWVSPSTIVTRDYDALLFVATGTVARRLPFAGAMYAEEPRLRMTLDNLDLEDAEGLQPRAWLWSPARERVCGYTAALDRERPFTGRASVRIERTGEPRYGECASQFRQLIDATTYRGQRVRLRAAVRVENASEHAHLYLQSGAHRVAQLVSGSGWRTHDVVLDVPSDAPSLEIGFAFDGEGRAWLDAVSFIALPTPPPP